MRASYPKLALITRPPAEQARPFCAIIIFLVDLRRKTAFLIAPAQFSCCAAQNHSP